MAVEAVVASMVDKLDELVSKDAQLLGMHGEINRIREELNKMRRFLKDADIKQKEDEAVRDWMEDIRDICFDVNDLIDILGQGQAAHGSLGFVQRLRTRCMVGRQIKRIKLNIRDVSKSRESYGIREINEERPEATSSTRHLQEGGRCSDQPKVTAVASTLPGDSEEVDSQEEINPGGQQLMEEEPRPRDGTTSSTPGLQADRPFSTLLQEPEEVGLQEEIDRVGPYDGTRDIDEGRQEASPSSKSLQDRRQPSAVLKGSEEVSLQEPINTVGQQLIKEEPGPYDGTRDIDEGRLDASSSASGLQADRRFSTLPGEGLQERINTVSEQLKEEEPRHEGKLEARYSTPGLQADRRFSTLLGEPKEVGLQDRRQSSAVLEGSELIGLQEEIKTLKEKLMNEDPSLRVISIFGMGGSGKTTLARKVYQDVQNYFDRRCFICLSQRFGIKDILRHIVKSLWGLMDFRWSMSSPYGNYWDIKDMGVGKLCGILSHFLREEKYLVVIDDIRSKEAWDTLEGIFPDGTSRSRVILITSNKEVALQADPSSHFHHVMRPLNDHDEGWELFMKKIFPGGDPSTACPSNLKETGRQILKKCKGIPLAILVLGGLLATKEKTFGAWSNVLDSVNWDLSVSHEVCSKILELSYLDLPDYLKPCFLYLGLFPEYSEIGSGRLARLWIAEGFIQEKDNKMMEDVAEDYLEELANRSLIQVVQKKSNGSVHKCRIHDLLRDLSLSVATKDNFFTIYNENSTSSSSTSVRRLAFQCVIDRYETSTSSTANLHSILSFQQDSGVSWPKLLNISGKLLRVLDVQNLVVHDLSFSRGASFEELGGFVHLRYLRIEFDTRFPSISIGNMSDLQTLQINRSGTLPDAIYNLMQLRHLNAFGYSIDGYTQLDNLRNLQTLCLTAGSWINDCLGKLTALRKLHIRGSLSAYKEALPVSIEQLRNLRSLKLVDAEYYALPMLMPFANHKNLYKMVLRGRIWRLSELPPNLAELYLLESKLEDDAIFTLEKLQNLKILYLIQESYIPKKMIFSSRGFPQLESLTLGELPLEEWTIEKGAVPSLKSVKLLYMPNFETQNLPERVRAVLSREALFGEMQDSRYKKLGNLI